MEGTLEDEALLQLNEMTNFIERLKNASSSVNNTDFFSYGTSRIFLRGIAGIGKTSFVEHLALSWANEKIFREFDFVFLFKCRTLIRYRDSTVTAEGLFNDLFNVDLKRLMADEEFDGERVLIVIDGLDELPSLESALGSGTTTPLHSILNRLFDKESAIFPGHKCILTGRPHIYSLLRKYELETIGKMTIVEITGFDEKTIESYVDNFTLGAAKIKEDILGKINNSSSLRVMASVPQFLSSLCSILATQKSTLISHRVTELYVWVLVSFIRQHFNELKDMPYKIFTDVRFTNFLEKITQISYHLLMENKIIFKTGELSALLATGDELERKMLDSFIVKTDTITECFYQFKHVSLQEFLAAIFCYVKGININTLLDKKMYVLVEFIAGFARASKCDSKEKQSVSSIFANSIRKKESFDFLFVVPTVAAIAHALLQKSKDRHITWRPLFSIFFELFYDDDKLPEIIKFECEMDFSFDHLTTIECTHFVHFLRLILASFGDDALSTVSIRIMNTDISLDTGKSLAPLVKYVRSFKCIASTVDTNFIQSISQFIQASKGASKLAMLAFNKCGLNDREIECVSGCLPYLETFEVSYNELTTTCLSSLANSFKVDDAVNFPSIRLREMRLHGCTFEVQSVSHLCKMVHFLETLDLTGCALNEEQISDIVDAIIRCKKDNTSCKLRDLILERCSLNDDCILKLCQVIPHLCCVNISRSATALNQQEFRSDIVDNMIRNIEFAYFQQQLSLKKLVMHSFSRNVETKKKFLALKCFGIDVSFKVWNQRHSVSSQF